MWKNIGKSRPHGRRNVDRPAVSKRTHGGVSSASVYLPADSAEAPYVEFYYDEELGLIGLEWAEEPGFRVSGNKRSRRRSINIPKALHDLIPEGYQTVELFERDGKLVFDTGALVETGAVPERAPAEEPAPAPAPAQEPEEAFGAPDVPPGNGDVSFNDAPAESPTPPVAPETSAPAPGEAGQETYQGYVTGTPPSTAPADGWPG